MTDGFDYESILMIGRVLGKDQYLQGNKTLPQLNIYQFRFLIERNEHKYSC